MSRRNAFAAALVAATFLLLDSSAHAQGAALERRLASATRVECRFETLATGDWNANSSSAAVTKVDHAATFFDIDVDGGTAEADGPFGTAFIVVRYAHGYLHFLQMSDAGPLHVTTVLAQETTGGRLKAVQTRHEYTPVALPGFTSRPEMYIGDCAVT